MDPGRDTHLRERERNLTTTPIFNATVCMEYLLTYDGVEHLVVSVIRWYLVVSIENPELG